MPRKKKYELIIDLEEKDINALNSIVEDYNTLRQLATSTYTITTSGGRNKVWQVNEKSGQYVTISSGSIGRRKVNNYISVNVYVHYVLTEAGVDFIKSLVMERSI